jgi:hypothetical protein
MKKSTYRVFSLAVSTVKKSQARIAAVQKLRHADCSTPTAAVRSGFLLRHGQRLESRTLLARFGWCLTTSSVIAQTSAATRVAEPCASRLRCGMKVTI